MTKYNTFIFDLDGTLYRQTPVRLRMLLHILSFLVRHPFRTREILIIKSFRKLRENRFGAESIDFYEKQIERLSVIYKLPEEEIIQIVEYWMDMLPLRLVARAVRKTVRSAIFTLKERGNIIIVYSDYPVSEKLRVLDIEADYSFYSGDAIVSCMKPDAKGLNAILRETGRNAGKCLYVGDRYEKDGLCAKKAGVDYMDVKNFEKEWRSL